jgi:hypothetical protein
MNLVVDDAIEVKQPTKSDPEESRRSLGMLISTTPHALTRALTCLARPNPPQGRQRCSDPDSMSLMLTLLRQCLEQPASLCIFAIDHDHLTSKIKPLPTWPLTRHLRAPPHPPSSPMHQPADDIEKESSAHQARTPLGYQEVRGGILLKNAEKGVGTYPKTVSFCSVHLLSLPNNTV